MPEVLDSSDLFIYFEELATKNKLVLHTPTAPRFARDSEEVGNLASFKMDMNNPFIVMDDISNKLVDKKSNNRLCLKTVRFFILQNVQMGDFAARQAVYELTERILWQFFAKWYRDKYEYLEPMRYLQPETVSWASVWLPEYETCYGTECSFSLYVPAEVNIIYDADNWLV